MTGIAQSRAAIADCGRDATGARGSGFVVMTQPSRALGRDGASRMRVRHGVRRVRARFVTPARRQRRLVR